MGIAVKWPYEAVRHTMDDADYHTIVGKILGRDGVLCDTLNRDYCVSPEEDREHAQFIERALNSHDQLVSACRKANALLARMAAQGGKPPEMDEWCEVQQELFRAITAATDPA